jgi:signal transduction histidine kinase
MAPAPLRAVALDVSLLRVFVGYRIIGAVWLVVLGVIFLAGSEDPDRPGVVVATMAAVVLWTAVVTALAIRRPRMVLTPMFVVVDATISAGVLVAQDLAGSVGFAGGYPLAAVFHAALAAGWAGGLGVGLVLTVTAAWQISRGPAVDPATVSGAVVVYLFSAAAASWAIVTLLERDRMRTAAEAALADEQAARARAEERAALTTRIHDGVLQTLALIQRDAGDANRVATLARRQERELREVLYAHPSHRRSFRGAIAEASAEVEELTGVRVDAVVVGDRPWDATIEAVVLAAREAALNAAKHSGAPMVAVYGEADRSRVEVFVRDRGGGFDAEAVPGDRHGIADSIVRRIADIGGEAVVSTSPGRGTEVHLCVKEETS